MIMMIRVIKKKMMVTILHDYFCSTDYVLKQIVIDNDDDDDDYNDNDEFQESSILSHNLD